MDETQALAPVVTTPGRKAPRPVRPWFELALCLLGSLGSLYLPALGCAAMVFGSWLLARREEGRAVWAVAGCLAPGVALSLVSWDLGSLVVPVELCALTLALLVPGRVGVTSVCLAIAGGALCMVGADASYAMLNGGNLATYVSGTFEEVRELSVASLGGSGASEAALASLDQILGLMETLWPCMYLFRAAGVVLAGLAGLVLARRDTLESVFRAFLHYDMPLWGLVGLVLMVLGLLGLSLPQGSDVLGRVLLSIVLNMAVCLRVLYFLQGLAVAMFLMRRQGFAPVARVLLLAVLLMAELGFFAVCVFGVIDVKANFRNLRRSDAR